MSSSKNSLAFPFSAHGVHHSGMTLQEYAAIQLKVPDSGTDWLDEMIRKSQRNDFAAAAMQSPGNGPFDVGDAMVAFISADVMMEEGQTQNAEDPNLDN